VEEEGVVDTAEGKEIEAEAVTIVMVDEGHHLVMMIADIMVAVVMEEEEEEEEETVDTVVEEEGEEVTMLRLILRQAEVITVGTEADILLLHCPLMAGTLLRLSNLMAGMEEEEILFHLVLLYQVMEELRLLMTTAIMAIVTMVAMVVAEEVMEVEVVAEEEGEGMEEEDEMVIGTDRESETMRLGGKHVR
jgi:hypothetical protein